jgi:hypothetical protein
MGAIIWLASYPKSGNTWLRAFLHNLLRNPQEGYDINKLDDFTLGESAYGWYHRFDDRPLESYSEAEVAALRPKVHRYLTTLFPDSIFAKTHCAVMEDHGVEFVFLPASHGDNCYAGTRGNCSSGDVIVIAVAPTDADGDRVDVEGHAEVVALALVHGISVEAGLSQIVAAGGRRAADAF